MTISNVEGSQDDRYREASTCYGGALERLARAYEADPDHRRDLLQEIHFALWRSLSAWEGRCSMRTWVYRVAHNVATSHVLRRRRANSHALVSLEDLDCEPAVNGNRLSAEEHYSVERLLALVQTLKPLDRQVILSYLEDMDAASIGEITGLSPGNVAVKIHRIKSVLAKRFQEGGHYGG